MDLHERQVTMVNDLRNTNSKQALRDKYAEENSRDKYGSPLEQITKALMADMRKSSKPGGQMGRKAAPASPAKETSGGFGKGKAATLDKSTKAAPKPTERPKRAPKLTDGGTVKPAPKPKSLAEGSEKSQRDAIHKANYLAGGPDRQRKSGMNVSQMAAKGSGKSKTDSDDAGYKLGKALGDRRSKKAMIEDRKAANKADRENRGR